MENKNIMDNITEKYMLNKYIFDNFLHLFIFLYNYFYKLITIYKEIVSCAECISDDELEIEHVNETKISKEKIVQKYDDKYRSQCKEWTFSENDTQLIDELTDTYYTELKNNIKSTVNYVSFDLEVDEEDKIVEEKKIVEEENALEVDDNVDAHAIKAKIEEDANILFREEAHKNALAYVINSKIDKLKNCVVMEKTPNGNVIMMYDKERESFTYYSDNAIPYKYLEVVGRKYVKMFDCYPLFVDMDAELQLFEAKLKKKQELLAEETAKNLLCPEPKKNVFVKFKTYNKDTSVKTSMACPSNNTNMSSKSSKHTVILKEKSNRYTCEGKMSNFSFLKKIEKKICNQKLGISFGDFKRMSRNAQMS